MANLLEETFENLTIDEVYEKVEWLRISFDDYEESIKIELPPGYEKHQLDAAMKSMDFTYDDDYGQQFVTGCVKFRDGSWLERCEYDGAEWWEHRSVPTWDYNEQQ